MQYCTHTRRARIRFCDGQVNRVLQYKWGDWVIKRQKVKAMFALFSSRIQETTEQ